MEESEPVKLTIPKIGVEANFESPLGLSPNSEIQVPVGYDTVGYYQFGPTPGELGPAVVLGHVDSLEGPAVFFSLGQLKVGDEIEIEREDGTVAVFTVTNLERHTQAGFPTEKVYSDINHAGLRLITCTGVYDRSNLRYTHNLIVFAELKDSYEITNQL
jgi:sortase (surface protein transpeptidase)